MKDVTHELLERFLTEVEQSFNAGEYAEARSMLRRFMRHRTQGKANLRMRILLGKSYLDEGKWKKALGDFEIARRDAQRQKDYKALSSVLNYIGDCRSTGGDIDAAVNFYYRSMTICREHGIADDTLARNISDLAQVAERKGQYSKALPKWEEAVAIYETLSNSRELAYALLNTAMLKSRQGRVDEAISDTEKSIAVLASLGQTVDISDGLWLLGMLNVQKGDYRAGFHHMEKAIRESSRTEGIGLLRAYSPYIKALIEVGRSADARFHAEKALAISRSLNWTHGIASFQALIGQARLDEDDLVAAIRYSQESSKAFEKMRYSPGMARTLLCLAEAQARAFNLAEAKKTLEKAVSIADQIDDVVMHGDCTLVRATVLILQKKSDPPVVRSLQKLHQQLEDTWNIQHLRVYCCLGTMLMLEGNFDDAADTVRELLAHTRLALESMPGELHDSFRNSPLCRAITKLVVELHVERTLQGTSIEKVMDSVERSEKDGPPRLSLGVEITQDEAVCPELVYQSDCMNELAKTARRIAGAPMPVLVTGETGVGKEVLARYIHHFSNCRGPFVPVNCAAIPSSLMESELFGYVQGAFTGANHDREGLFAAADEGTLFLDEIGDMPTEMQAKLLRVLEEKKVRPLGATELAKADIRLICATNRDLRKEVEKGRFREDLFYRINAITLDVPPLRARKEDIIPLSEYFMAQYGEPAVIEREARDALMGYDWPGNVREVKNEMARLLAVSEGRICEPMLK